jgi:hypothetical protein
MRSNEVATLTQDSAGDEQSITCPKCGEKNMTADVRCWACDAELHPAAEPRLEPAHAEPVVPDDYLGAPRPAASTRWLLHKVVGPIVLAIVLLAAAGEGYVETARSVRTGYIPYHEGHRGGPSSPSVWRSRTPITFRSAIARDTVYNMLWVAVALYCLFRAFRNYRDYRDELRR